MYPPPISMKKVVYIDMDGVIVDFGHQVEKVMKDPQLSAASKVLKSGKNKKEVKNDLLSMMAPPIIKSCSTISSFDDPLAL